MYPYLFYVLFQVLIHLLCLINFLHHNFNITAKGDCGYTLRKIYGPTRFHKDGIVVDNKHDILNKESGNLYLDYNNDDYYNHSIDGCLDLKNSKYLVENN